MEGHTLVAVDPVDVGYETVCRCGHSEWAMSKFDAIVALEAHMDRMIAVSS